MSNSIKVCLWVLFFVSKVYTIPYFQQKELEDVQKCINQNSFKFGVVTGELNELNQRDKSSLAFGLQDHGRYTAELAYRNHNKLKDMPLSQSQIISGQYFGPKSHYFTHQIRNSIFILGLTNSDNDSLQTIIDFEENNKPQQEHQEIRLEEKHTFAYYTRLEFNATDQQNGFAVNIITLIGGSSNVQRKIYEDKTYLVDSIKGIRGSDYFAQIVFSSSTRNYFKGHKQQIKDLAELLIDIFELRYRCNKELPCEYPGISLMKDGLKLKLNPKIFNNQGNELLIINCNRDRDPTRQVCWYTQPSYQIKQGIVTKRVPYISSSNSIRSLQEYRGFLIQALDTQQSKYVQISIWLSQSSQKGYVKQLELRYGIYTTAIKVIRIERDIYLYSFLIIESKSNKIFRTITKESMFVYDKLTGVEEVEIVYSFIFAVRRRRGSLNLKLVFRNLIEVINHGYLQEQKLTGCQLPKSFNKFKEMNDFKVFLQAKAQQTEDQFESQQQIMSMNDQKCICQCDCFCECDCNCGYKEYIHECKQQQPDKQKQKCQIQKSSRRKRDKQLTSNNFENQFEFTYEVVGEKIGNKQLSGHNNYPKHHKYQTDSSSDQDYSDYSDQQTTSSSGYDSSFSSEDGIYDTSISNQSSDSSQYDFSEEDQDIQEKASQKQDHIAKHDDKIDSQEQKESEECQEHNYESLQNQQSLDTYQKDLATKDQAEAQQYKEKQLTDNKQQKSSLEEIPNIGQEPEGGILDHLCFLAYNECQFQGRCLNICGEFPDIPAPLQHFFIKSVKIPKGIKINFYADSNYQGDGKITLEGNEPCLSQPFEISLISRRPSSFPQQSSIMKVDEQTY